MGSSITWVTGYRQFALIGSYSDRTRGSRCAAHPTRESKTERFAWRRLTADSKLGIRTPRTKLDGCFRGRSNPDPLNGCRLLDSKWPRGTLKTAVMRLGFVLRLLAQVEAAPALKRSSLEEEEGR
jgi:hypothetical protein